MTTEQIKIVKQSWRIFQQINPTIVGDLFYSKLFTDSPSLRKMFPKNMEEQYKKLVEMLTAIIMRLEHLEALTEDIAAMAKRHATYGVKPIHYTLVGTALLWTLKQGLGKDWNEEIAAAWTSCYSLLANTMIAAANSEVAPE